MSTKPFDLEAALRGEPVVDGDGRKVINIHLLPRWVDSQYSLYVQFESGNIERFQGYGKGLFMVPKKFALWVNIYANGAMENHNSKEDADKDAWPGRIACIRAEFEEGEGL